MLVDSLSQGHAGVNKKSRAVTRLRRQVKALRGGKIALRPEADIFLQIPVEELKVIDVEGACGKRRYAGFILGTVDIRDLQDAARLVDIAAAERLLLPLDRPVVAHEAGGLMV